MPSAGVKIYIGNLPERARPEEIKECFTKYGNVVNMELKGTYGFIEYEERRMCDEAITQLHGTDFQGSQLRVEYAHAERSGGYKYREGKSTDTCFKCGQVGHWARECTSNGRDLSSHRKISSRYEDRRISDSYVREPYSARDGRDKYDRDERYLPPPPLDRSYDRPGYDRYAREPELDYRREYRSTYDRGYERERERAYDRAYPERDYERYPRDNYDRSYYPPPPRDGYERDGYERRALAPPDVTAYPARGRTGSPQPRRSSYERIRDAPLSSSYRRSPPPPSRYTDSLIGPPPLRPPPSPRASLYRRRSLSPMRSSRAPPPYSGRPRSPSPLSRAIPARRGGPRTPTPPARR